jgi:hypothetical protein
MAFIQLLRAPANETGPARCTERWKAPDVGAALVVFSSLFKFVASASQSGAEQVFIH